MAVSTKEEGTRAATDATAPARTRVVAMRRIRDRDHREVAAVASEPQSRQTAGTRRWCMASAPRSPRTPFEAWNSSSPMGGQRRDNQEKSGTKKANSAGEVYAGPHHLQRRRPASSAHSRRNR